MIEHEGIKWTNFKNPGKAEIEYARESFDIHPIIIKELYHPTLHPKINFYDDYIFLVLRFPERENGETVPTEVDFIITKKEVITYQYETLEVLDEIFNKVKQNPSEYLNKNIGFLVYQILQELSDKLTPQIDEISRQIDHIEKQIFADGNREMLKNISVVRRDSNDFLSIIKPNLDVLDDASEKVKDMFGKEIDPYFNHLKLTYARLVHVAETHGSTLQMLHETNESMVSNDLNKIIKILTIFSVIVFPLTLFAGIWGMNVVNMPLVGHPYDFWIVLTLMAITTLIMLIVFKIKRWI